MIIDCQAGRAQRLWGAGAAVQLAAGSLSAGYHRLQAVGHGAHGIHGHQALLPGAAGRPQAQDGRLRTYPGCPLRGAPQLLATLARLAHSQRALAAHIWDAAPESASNGDHPEAEKSRTIINFTLGWESKC